MSEGPPLELLACPRCRNGSLRGVVDAIECERCGMRYAVDGGIPVLLSNGDGDPHKARQAEFFDAETSEEYEITRPHGAPAFHAWLLEDKFRRSVSALRGLLPGAAVLTLCGGSGMDAEFLARAGANVVNCDISLGAARRAHERARRYDLAITSIVGDAERLPFPDRAFDIVYVHDGLHHLERPLDGLAEMARVARRAVSVTEPARAAATALAMRLGLALSKEEAGNPVRRLSLDEIVDELAARGFEVVVAGRYAMLYRHEPGSPMRLLSRRRIFPVATATHSAFNRAAGRIGNKLNVQAVRA